MLSLLLDMLSSQHLLYLCFCLNPVIIRLVISAVSGVIALLRTELAINKPGCCFG